MRNGYDGVSRELEAQETLYQRTGPLVASSSTSTLPFLNMAPQDRITASGHDSNAAPRYQRLVGGYGASGLSS